MNFVKAEKMVWREFTTERYKEYLKLALDEGYEFITYKEYKEYISKNRKFVLWRHDLDLSVHRGYQLAKDVQTDLFWSGSG